MALSVAASDGGSGIYPSRISAIALRAGLDQNAWYAPAFLQPPPVSYVLAYRRQAGAADYGFARDLIWFGDLTAYDGRAVRLCYGSDVIGVAGLEYRRVDSVTPIDSGAYVPAPNGQQPSADGP